MKKNHRKPLLIMVAIIVVTGSGIYFWQKSDFYHSKNVIPEANNVTETIDKLWEGKWVLEGSSQDYSGTLSIKNETESSFSFVLDTYNGAHSGNINGQAKIAGNNASSIIGDEREKEYQCQVTFSKNGGKIKVETTNSDCVYFRGARAFFEGSYIENGVVKERTLKDIGRVVGGSGPDETYLIFKNDTEVDFFQKTVGDKNVKLFIDSFQWVARADDTENLNARIYNGGVTGLSTTQEGIIIIGQSNRIWAAVIDYDAVRYFTNVPDYTNRLPKAIEKWRERFQDKKVIFMSSH